MNEVPPEQTLEQEQISSEYGIELSPGFYLKEEDADNIEGGVSVHIHRKIFTLFTADSAPKDYHEEAPRYTIGYYTASYKNATPEFITNKIFKDSSPIRVESNPPFSRAYYPRKGEYKFVTVGIFKGTFGTGEQYLTGERAISVGKFKDTIEKGERKEKLIDYIEAMRRIEIQERKMYVEAAETFNG
ncbi:MAG: hypothetical protein HYW89_03750 [Candidatus Sungiibacteriota bacterium]|uniref:Uncharacterized protein n=1 Tax=Candidatus Sungiibacteriota bacterium TaxID=2750080 RepID=A0A7T5RJ28_9BACT|nr:MAG: hypothetical protein HYW89_03750 [Candidatus Sungbacteria bacterium]